MARGALTSRRGVTVPGISAADRGAYRALSTSAISDALDRLQINGQCAGIMPLSRSFRLVGQAFTVRYVPAGSASGTVGDYIDDLGEGQVVVLDNDGRLDATVWGDLLTATAHQRNLEGAVIDGVCRDSDQSLAVNFPIYSRGRWMRTGKDRVLVDAYQVPVSVGGVRVEPGDLLVGDADGVVCVPLPHVREVLDTATAISAAEEQIRASVLSGVKLVDARRAANYHTLQTPR
jgi:4-hydroxy-4-methyl-2-oxoglutarate aldolase